MEISLEEIAAALDKANAEFNADRSRIEPYWAAYDVWLRDHGLDPVRVCQTTLHTIDIPLIRVYECVEQLGSDGDLEFMETLRDVAMRSSPPAPPSPQWDRVQVVQSG